MSARRRSSLRVSMLSAESTWGVLPVPFARRLCNKASRETRWVMQLIRREVMKIDSVVGDAMIPMCYYRGGVCHEIVPCVPRDRVVL